MYTRTTRFAAFFVIVPLYVAVCTLHAAGPSFINYRASLTDTLGNPVPDSTYLVHFGIYDVETGGVALWTEDHSVLTHNGGFKVKLGQFNALHDSVFAHYFPSWQEIEITLAVIVSEIWVFRWVVNRMPVLSEPPRWAREKHDHVETTKEQVRWTASGM